jgi:protein FrlC
MASLKEIKIANMNVHYYLYPFDYFLDVQNEIGIKNIELWGSVPHLWIDHIRYRDIAPIRKKLVDYGIDIVAFTPKPYNYTLCAPYESTQRKATLTYYKNCIDATVNLGVNRMCIDSTGGSFDTPYEILWNCCRDLLIHLCRIAKSKDVMIIMGTALPGLSKVVTTLHELKEMVDCVARDNLKVLLDTVAMSMSGETIGQWFGVFGSNIVHTHFTDGRNNGYRVWGEGCYPMKKYLYELYHNGYTGYLGQKILNEDYFTDPAEADRKNFTSICQYITGGNDNNGFD